MAQKAKAVPLPPPWFHRNGRRMDFEAFNPTRKELVLRDAHYPDAASVRLRVTKRRYFCVTLLWRIAHHHGLSSGYVYMTEKDVVNAFGLSPFDYAYANQADTYHREREWLCVPRKGTGRDGDPNIAIMLTPNIQEGVKKLLRYVP